MGIAIIAFPFHYYVEFEGFVVPAEIYCIAYGWAFMGICILLAFVMNAILRKRASSGILIALTLVPLSIFVLQGHAISEKWQARWRPDEKRLLSNFHENRTRLDRLVAMIHEDKGLLRVDCTWTLPRNLESIGVTPSRVRLYRRILDEIEVPRGFYVYEFDDGMRIDFLAVSYGLLDDGIARGYTYVRPSSGALDAITDPAAMKYIKNHIDGNWYYFEE
jgi:hypothetical protein